VFSSIVEKVLEVPEGSTDT